MQTLRYKKSAVCYSPVKYNDVFVDRYAFALVRYAKFPNRNFTRLAKPYYCGTTSNSNQELYSSLRFMWRNETSHELELEMCQTLPRYSIFIQPIRPARATERNPRPRDPLDVSVPMGILRFRNLMDYIFCCSLA